MLRCDPRSQFASLSVLSPQWLSSLDVKLKGSLRLLTGMQKPGCILDIWNLLAFKCPPETVCIYDATKKTRVLGHIE